MELNRLTKPKFNLALMVSGDNLVYFETPKQAIQTYLALQTMNEKTSVNTDVELKVSDGSMLRLICINNEAIWTDGEHEFQSDSEGYPLTHQGIRFELMEVTSKPATYDPESEPLVLVKYDNSVGVRCWTPKQAIEAASYIGDMFGAENVTITVYPSYDPADVWVLRRRESAFNPAITEYCWENGVTAVVKGDADLWPIYNDIKQRMPLCIPPAPDGGATLADKPRSVSHPVEASGPGFVLQPWVATIPMMQQTVLMTALRGPDTLPKYGPAKYLLRWYRRCILLSAMDRKVLKDPIEPNGGSFTGPSCDINDANAAWYLTLPKGLSDDKLADLMQERENKNGPELWGPYMDELVGRYLQNLDATPYHYHGHFMHGAQVLGVQHPDPGIREWWWKVYVRLVDELHLHPETPEEMNKRLGDDRSAWLERADVALSD